MMMNEKELLSFWHISFDRKGDHALIAGSPNRMEKRFLFHDEKGVSYIAEGFRREKREYLFFFVTYCRP